MKRKILIGALLGALFLTGLVAALPATLLSLPLLRATGDRWQFSGARKERCGRARRSWSM
ncbi:hypothetical protein JOS77_07255 [Chromobacterium haemolyticum]|nr:hypothetical protein JOS77_07255 [Chromobacterium haemolyticum]